MTNYKLDMQKRDKVGSNAVRKLRVKELIPGVIYGKDFEPINVTVDEKELRKVHLMAGTSSLIDVKVDGEEHTVIIKDVQKHPFKNHYVHVDFKEIKMGEVANFTIPVVLEGRDEIRLQPSVLMQLLDEVEIECLPKNLPNEAAVSVIDMQYGDTFEVKDLDVFKNPDIKVLNDETEAVCSLSEPKEEVIEEDVEEVSADVPTVSETEEEDAE
ncbi:50S ribosomal protein L25 [Finegoldia magna]|uniref:Large ribosomal subunit protein bL25 n=3 Tax=Finegoldia magna TaxID=1260 RepID=RL25_FINM2|nr:50S ribosomal protein L25 [Finegoldia magna]B0S2F8.1 RecName: Full=Large ribosomal subunit protein bL25; AltName: Full=50S ribosomal protein L25; AltName: Full=General stress protein CTC [Finegoldia magna ATCC 29328]EFK94585.1 ribosomal protein L25, Ctc-form [Finegoldia magna ACS-171-V-Col3]EFL54135.1 ribosomal protein L25, Ctc-form [Finegoldia magna BVS033A4]EGS34708.1 ribosomal protein L25, Ctc-form [Finegoldia magna SY403409CC001050417]EXF26512.1 50S ribosomal protein L25 [Finegoldia mag